MLKLLRRKSFRRSKDFKTDAADGADVSRERTRQEGGGGGGGRRSSTNSVTTGVGQYTQKRGSTTVVPASASQYSFSQQPAAGSDKYNSWDRKSQGSGHRYYSISTNTLKSAADSPPAILQYARPPENLTSPNRESTGVLQDSLTPSPSLQKKISSEQKRRESESSKARRASSGGVLSALRNSFRRKSRKSIPISQTTSALHQRQQHYQVVKLPTSPSATVQQPHQQSSTTTTRRSGSSNSVRSTSATPSTTSTTATAPPNRQQQLLLPGRAASPGKPVQIVAPFQQVVSPIQESSTVGIKMRDPVVVPSTSHETSGPHHRPSHVLPQVSSSSGGSGRQQRHLPQTPKEASKTGLSGGRNGSGVGAVPITSSSTSSSSRNHSSAANKAVVSPVVHPVVPTQQHHSVVPRPAQRMSLRNKVGGKKFLGEEEEFSSLHPPQRAPPRDANWGVRHWKPVRINP